MEWNGMEWKELIADSLTSKNENNNATNAHNVYITHTRTQPEKICIRKGQQQQPNRTREQ